MALSISIAAAQIPSLRTVPVPQPTGLDRYVRDNAALTALGKALFWDVQVGSDGQTACATCHFHAGADHRVRNMIANPHSVAQTAVPNRALTLADFPFRKLVNPNDNRSAVERDTRMVMGSAGVIQRKFMDIVAGNGFDDGSEEPGLTAFAIGGVKARQVTARNTPSVINSVFWVVNFWDGRASSVFTGGTPFGPADSEWRAAVLRDGKLEREAVRMDNASLASQAVGPALNDVEMSYSGRSWPKLARKMFAVAPLAHQRVSPADSVLGEFANAEGNGLAPERSYEALVRAAFRPEYWESGELDADGYSQRELNFPLFFGLAVQAYESALISADSPFDRFQEGDASALTAQERDGIRVFQGGSECHECHQGPEFTAASFTNVRGRGGRETATPATLGFFRTGVSPVAEDLGGGGKDEFGNALFPRAAGNNARGVFKSPALRNVELTGPYFHDGSQATLEQVVAFYGRGGDFPGDGNLGPGMNRINMNANDRLAIVALMKALTGESVKFERAPFDHPSLCVPVGHAESAPGVLMVDDSSSATRFSAVDRWALVPAVGREGNSAPLQTFEELLSGIGSDGSRAHAMTESCEPPPASRP